MHDSLQQDMNEKMAKILKEIKEKDKCGPDGGSTASSSQSISDQQQLIEMIKEQMKEGKDKDAKIEALNQEIEHLKRDHQDLSNDND